MGYNVVKVVLNRKAVSNQLLKGAGTKAVLQATAARVAANAGIGTKTDAYDGVNRSNVSIWPATWEDYRINQDTNALLKALH